MKNFKKTIALFVIALFASHVAQAQENPQKSEKREMLRKRMEETATRLQLTPEQQTKVAEINRGFAEKLRGQKKESKTKQIKEMKAVKAERDAAMKQVLNESQYTKYLEIQNERKAEFKQKRAERQEKQTVKPE